MTVSVIVLVKFKLELCIFVLAFSGFQTMFVSWHHFITVPSLEKYREMWNPKLCNFSTANSSLNGPVTFSCFSKDSNSIFNVKRRPSLRECDSSIYPLGLACPFWPFSEFYWGRPGGDVTLLSWATSQTTAEVKIFEVTWTTKVYVSLDFSGELPICPMNGENGFDIYKCWLFINRFNAGWVCQASW